MTDKTYIDIMKRLFFVMLFAGLLASCSSKYNMPLAGTEWKLVELNGVKHDAFAESTDTFHFTLDAENHSLNGVGACNRFFGSYESGGKDSLRLLSVGMTRMACHNMDLETEFVRALDRVDRYRIDGDRLHLFDGDRRIAELTGCAAAEQ